MITKKKKHYIYFGVALLLTIIVFPQILLAIFAIWAIIAGFLTWKFRNEEI
jgi:hypothetical protein